MDFASDNRAPADGAILEALAAENARFGAAYGDDDVTEAVTAGLAAMFETELLAYPVTTGTAANALAIAALCPPWGAVFCHRQAHLQVDECGAPEMMAGAVKLLPVDGEDGKIAVEALEAAVGALEVGGPHGVQPAVLSLTQPTERGTCYTHGEIDALVAVAKRHGLRVHLDGARFANAVCASGGSPADHSWRRGVDVLSLGATKSGALFAETVIFFDASSAEGFAWRRKRAGQLVSKMRFVSAQLQAWLSGERWRELAGHANAMASRLGEGLGAIEGVRLAHPVEVNMVFAEMPTPVVKGLRGRGFSFFDWGSGSGSLVRLVTSHATTAESVDALVEATRELTASTGE